MNEPEMSQAAIATALRAEERYLVKRLSMVRELLKDMNKPGPKPKQQVSIPGDNGQALTHETANDGSNSDTTCPGEGGQPKEGNCPHEWYYDALSMKTVCKKCWKIKSTQDLGIKGNA